MLRSRMARRIYLWLPSLTVFALSACGGSESDFFSSGGRSGSSHAGASSHAGSSSTASAGSPSSAGNFGSAGADVAGSTSSGGSPGSGGDSEGGRSSGGTSSGGTGSSGRAGASSGGGSGGRPGTGGSGATAGHGGRSSGAGGTNDTTTCDDLHKLAEEQLDAARACNVAMSAPQCTTTVQNTCDCPVPVRREDSAETKAYLATMKKVKDKNCSWFCTKQACQQVTDADCKSSGSGSMGVCTVIDGPGHGGF